MKISDRTATLLGFFAASFVAALSVTLITSTNLGYERAAWLLPLFLLFSLGFAALFGMPSYCLLERYGTVTWWSTALTGALIGVVAAVVISWPSSPQAKQLIAFSVIGCLSAFVFWLVWRMADRAPPTLSS